MFNLFKRDDKKWQLEHKIKKIVAKKTQMDVALLILSSPQLNNLCNMKKVNRGGH